MLRQINSKVCLVVLILTGLLFTNVYAGIGLRPLDFFRFSEEDLGKKVQLSFNPDEGLQLRENFEKKYGTRGEQLIKSLGEGTITAENNYLLNRNT